MTAWISSLRRSLASNAPTAALVVLSSSALVAMTANANANASARATVVSSHDESTASTTTLCEPPPPPPPPSPPPERTGQKSSHTDGTKLIFLGSGSSTGCPIGECLFTLPPVVLPPTWNQNNKEQSSPQWIPQPQCRVSHLASQGGDPKFNKNYRNNPSLLIHHYHNGSYKNIIIDVGKTFREGAIRWFPEFQIQSLDAIVLTHEHMDAAAGLDDVRSFQPRIMSSTNSGPPTRKPVPLYLSQHCHDMLSRQFPFLLPPKKTTTTDDATPSCGCGGSDPVIGTSMTPAQIPPIIVQRDVAGFDVNIFQAFQPMNIEGLEIVPLPVWHGDDLISYGFAFSVVPRKQQEGGPDTSVNVVYISDVSRMIDETLEYIQKTLPPTDILVVDALLWHRTHPTHFSLDQAIELMNHQIQPRMGMYVVGMSCESYPPHEEMEDHLMTLYGGKVRMAHDGLCLSLDD